MLSKGNLLGSSVLFVLIIGNMYSSLLVTLFVSLTVTASMGIQIITEDVQSCCLAGTYRVINWKQNYCSVLDFIAEIDHVFGPSLLILIATQFIMFVLQSFQIVFDKFQGVINYFSIFYLMINCGWISMVIFGSYFIKTKVSRVTFISRETSFLTFFIQGFKFHQSLG